MSRACRKSIAKTTMFVVRPFEIVVCTQSVKYLLRNKRKKEKYVNILLLYVIKYVLNKAFVFGIDYPNGTRLIIIIIANRVWFYRAKK